MRSALRLVFIIIGGCAYIGLAILGWSGFRLFFFSPSVDRAGCGDVRALNHIVFRRRKS